MTRYILTALAALLAASLAPSVALAKGPIEASIDGPGLASPIQVGDRDNWGDEEAMAAHQPIMQLAEAAGFFPAAFSQVPDPMLDRRPEGDLGPRYVVEYRVPGPNNDEFRIVQDLYPYATPDPVTYTAPGQPLFEMDGTRGGWFVASEPALMPILTDAGLPESPPTGAENSPFPWTAVGAIAMAALLVAGAVGLALVRRRPEAVTGT